VALLLFDIDGTLIRPTGMGRRAIEQALCDLHGRLPADSFPYDGMLDPQIAEKALSSMGLAPTPSAVDRLLGLYLERLQEHRPSDPAASLCPGFPGLLDQARRRGHHLGLLTGNLHDGARTKLSFVDLSGYFFIAGDDGRLLGAFGGDAQQRWDLVAIAVARCERVYGRSFPASETWIVGDSPRDVQAARMAGVRCAAVATGLASLQTLAGFAPDLLFPDLSDPSALWSAAEDAA
jgi:phosphoglycolate phosphatase-like HAD superfamily hydrolase